MTQATLEQQQKELDVKLEQLQLLCQVSSSVGTSPPFDASPMDYASDDWAESDSLWTMDETTASDSSSSLPDFFPDDEEDETLPYLYDPTLFSSARALRKMSDAEKPLPVPPMQPLRVRVPPAPPSSPRAMGFTPPSLQSTTPPDSPSSDETIMFSQTRGPAFRPQPALDTRSGNRSNFPITGIAQTEQGVRLPSSPRHNTFPSISSTLSILGERETKDEKRAAVYVDDAHQGDAREVAFPVHFDTPRSSSDSAAGISSLRKKQRPILPTLSTSTSSPQLRTLAVLAATPTSVSLSTTPPILAESYEAANPVSSSSVPVTQLSTPVELEKPLVSRWSLDSVASRPSPETLKSASTPVVEEPPKRNRLISFISRSRAGSVGKTATPAGTPPETPGTPRPSSSREGLFGIVSPSKQSFTLPIQTPPITAVSFPGGSSPSTSFSASVSALQTPIDQAHHSPAKADASLPSEDGLRMDDMFSRASPPPADELPLPPLLPAPSPSLPSPSLLVPPRPPSFFAALKRRPRRRAKKLVISGGPFLGPRGRNRSRILSAEEDQQRWERDQKKRYDNVVRWCQSFGAVRKIEKAEDGSLHVYWEKWEVADMVCRVQAQVFIKEVGRVSLAWHYIS